MGLGVFTKEGSIFTLVLQMGNRGIGRRSSPEKVNSRFDNLTFGVYANAVYRVALALITLELFLNSLSILCTFLTLCSLMGYREQATQDRLPGPSFFSAVTVGSWFWSWPFWRF